MLKATEMLKNLGEAGLSDDEARNIVKGRIETGTVENDLTVESNTFSGEIEAVERAADAIAKAMGGQFTPVSKRSDRDDDDSAIGGHPEMNTATQKGEGDEEEEEEEEEGGGEEEEEEEDDVYRAEEPATLVKSETNNEDYDIVAIVSKGADEILESVERRNDALAKGYLKANEAIGALAKAITHNNGRFSEIEEKLDTVLKSLGTPVPPRAVTGNVETVPAPGETELAKAGNDIGASKANVISFIHKSLSDAPQDATRNYELSMAVAELDSGIPADVVCRKYNIAVNN